MPSVSVANCGKKKAVSCKLVLAFTSENSSFAPFFVVIITTPLAPLLPYKALASVPFRVDISSISSVFKLETSPLKITPSITYRGVLDAFMFPMPRILTKAVCPGLPFADTTWSPEASPSSISSISAAGAAIFFLTAPVYSIFLSLAYPLTTTSSKVLSFGVRLTLITLSEPTVFSITE